MASATMHRTVTFEDLTRVIAECDPSYRTVVAIAGAPGSGKSTLAERLVSCLTEGAEGRPNPFHHKLGLNSYHRF
jgi:pantothenate kinase